LICLQDCVFLDNQLHNLAVRPSTIEQDTKSKNKPLAFLIAMPKLKKSCH